ncbi:hypothetical protein [Parasedimentitalea maritima]|uniref:Sulfotransferase family protein n=1 Tax=Parasedimentitalea maritima TaxID=2578117 RepID=A0A6A4RG62_9RHOB|nr:hypothetical protein [Zongyanglinia marina]KAE9628994.1 hypothetical protein GP644_14615 [Zongyanglinia marina]
MRLILYAGFHKTGTSSVQRALSQNNALLDPFVRVLMKQDMTALCEAARAWSISRDTLDHGLLQYECAELISSLDPDDPRPVLLASEDLAGHMPGRLGLETYDAVPALMGTIRQTATLVRTDIDMSFYFSTRAKDAWLRSCYAQHLRASDLTADEGDYVKNHQTSADFAPILEKVRDVVAPHSVTSVSLEASRQTDNGPLGPILDLLGVPQSLRHKLTPVPAINTRLPKALQQKLLEINRSPLPYKERHQQKQSLIAGWHE